MMRALVLLLMISASPPLCAAGGRLADVSDSEKNAIYSGAIRGIFPKWQFDEKKIALIVIENQTRVDSFDGPMIAAGDIRAELPNLSDDLLADFRAKNVARSQLQLAPVLPGPWKPFESSEVNGQFPAGGWLAFYQHFPGSPGLLSVSSIGVNRTCDQALVYIAHIYGVDGGQGHVFLLKKRGTNWGVIKHGIVWVWVG